MSMANLVPVWTTEMLDGLPKDGNRYEIIDGELLVTPAPTRLHQEIVMSLGVALRQYAAQQPGAHASVFFVAADIARDSHTLVQPDVLVINTASEPDHSSWPPLKCLMLAAEVLSPSTARRDRTSKRAVYLGEGVEYWVLDPDARAIERWLPGSLTPVVETRRLVWQPAGADRALSLQVGALFDLPNASPR